MRKKTTKLNFIIIIIIIIVIIVIILIIFVLNYRQKIGTKIINIINITLQNSSLKQSDKVLHATAAPLSQMDAYYDFQIRQQHQQSTFHRPTRQFGCGGMGAFGLRIGRVAMPLVKKSVLHVAKRFSEKLVSSFVPEFSNNIFGEKRPRKAVRDVLKHSANKTIARATETRGVTAGAGAVATAAGGGPGERSKRRERAGNRAPPARKKVSKAVANLQPAFLQLGKTSF